MSAEELVAEEVHDVAAEASIPCGICDATFATEADAALHRKEEHGFWA